MLIHHEKAKISVNERKGKMCNDVEREMERRVNAVFQSRSGCRLPFRRKETTWISVPKKIENGGYESRSGFSLSHLIFPSLSWFHFCSHFFTFLAPPLMPHTPSSDISCHFFISTNLQFLYVCIIVYKI